MWKIIALVTAITLGVCSSAPAADKPALDPRLKQMEELGALRGRLNYKLEDLRRMLSQPALLVRSNALTENYNKARAATNAKIATENAKALKDQATLDACAARLAALDAAVTKGTRAWQMYLYTMADQGEVASYLNTLLQLCAYDDYWNRSDMDVQLLVNIAAAVEGKADQSRTKTAAAIAEITKVLDDVEPICKE